MRKDGTVYLALIEFENGDKDWEIIRWAEPTGLSSNTNQSKWVNKSGFALRLTSISLFKELDVIVENTIFETTPNV